MKFEVKSEPELKFVGLELSGPYSKLSEMGQLWAEFSSRIPEILHRANPEKRAVSYGLSNTRQHDFTYYACVEVADFNGTPSGMAQLTVSPQRYAVFTHHGPMSAFQDTIETARQTLTSEGHVIDPDAFWFERYDERFDPTAAVTECELYFPLK